MDCRGFESVGAMNDYMIKQWNSRVKKNDEVIILGDLCLSRDIKEIGDILDKLKGKKQLIIGNHDKYLDNKFFDRSKFEWIEYYKELNENNRKVVLSHYPIMCYDGQYRRDSEGKAKVYMLYGHVHNTFDEYIVNEYVQGMKQYKRPMVGTDEKYTVPCQMINCFCMFSDYIPMTLD